MAVVAPFRALRYNPNPVGDLGRVITPPYDIISRAEQEAFYALHPYNMIRLELGKASAEDTEENNAHTRAARYLAQWRQDGVLVREVQPAFFPYELDYPMGDKRKTRKGFFGLLRLEEFGSGCVRPHERTFQKVKDERLALMVRCRAHLSPIFVLFSDPEGRVRDVLFDPGAREELARCADFRGCEHRLYRLADPGRVRRIHELMADKDIFIADGHHRYETALNYRRLRMQEQPDASEEAPFHYVLTYFCPMEDDGLVVLPTHRLLPRLARASAKEFLEKGRPFFQALSFAMTDAGRKAWNESLETFRARRETAIGFVHKEGEACWVLKMEPAATRAFLAEKGFPEVLRDLDVVVVDHLLLRGLLGLDDAYLSDAENIRFCHDGDEALRTVLQGDAAMGFFVNPTRVDQVREVARAGLIMPHKATYFYPKVFSGLVMHPMDPGDRVAVPTP
ncbi:MAG: DUF1015 domain-containing protein [Desulfosoma sp.]